MSRRSDSSLNELVVFLGPSLRADEARAVAQCRVLPPARQGDVWKALSYRPRIIVLIDGVFELQPAVWHRELLAAIDAGVTVFGASSMGALRAAELDTYGMVGIGTIYDGYARGRLVDDSEVALLHAGEEDRFRPLTVPLVQVRHTAELSRRARVLDRRQAERLIRSGEEIFYQERYWPEILQKVGRGFPAERFRNWLGQGVEDVKAADARACLRAAEAFRGGAKVAPPRPPSPAASSLTRRSRLHQGWTRLGAREVPNATILESLRRRADADTLIADGTRRKLIAGWARASGLEVSLELLQRARAQWRSRSGPAEATAIDEDELDRILAEEILERRWLALSEYVLSDGPESDEALADTARLRGLWLQGL